MFMSCRMFFQVVLQVVDFLFVPLHRYWILMPDEETLYRNIRMPDERGGQ